VSALGGKADEIGQKADIHAGHLIVTNPAADIPFCLATPDTDAPGRSASSTMRHPSASLKRWRAPGGADRAEGI
jgi:hypothetical protein